MYGLLSTLLRRGDDELQYAIYDNACALARLSRHPLRRDRTPAASGIAAFTFVIDANHTACITEGHDFFLPEVRCEEHPRLAAVNTQTAEQFFAWADPFVRSTSSMAPSVFQAFVLILVHLYNLLVCSDSVVRSRRRSGGRRNPPAPGRPSHTPAARAPVPADVPEASPAAVILRFRCNPHGVGLWGAGKYHWCPDPHAPRPPCKIVSFETLPETIEVTTEDVDFVPDVGLFSTLLGRGIRYAAHAPWRRSMQVFYSIESSGL